MKYKTMVDEFDYYIESPVSTKQERFLYSIYISRKRHNIKFLSFWRMYCKQIQTCRSE